MLSLKSCASTVEIEDFPSVIASGLVDDSQGKCNDVQCSKLGSMVS